MEIESISQCFRDVQVATGNVRAAVHDLGQDLSSLEANVETHTTGQHGMSDAFGDVLHTVGA